MPALHANEEMFQIAGDRNPLGDSEAANLYREGAMLDPTGTGLMGHGSELDLTKNAIGHPLIRWRDLVMEADVYHPMEGVLEVHIHCPKCSTPDDPHVLRITSERKSIEYDKKRNLLYVEPFECCWELPAERRQEFGLGLCKWRVAIDGDRAVDA